MNFRLVVPSLEDWEGETDSCWLPQGWTIDSFDLYNDRDKKQSKELKNFCLEGTWVIDDLTQKENRSTIKFSFPLSRVWRAKIIEIRKKSVSPATVNLPYHHHYHPPI